MYNDEKMNIQDKSREHWEHIFQNRDTSKVSWFQDKPNKSLELIEQYMTPKASKILDVGGGDSRLPDGLIVQGYENIFVLDISEYALVESKRRLSENSHKVNWIVSNVLNLDGNQKFDLWHDRAVFHFLTNVNDQIKYSERLYANLVKNGVAIIASFSKNGGPEKCSGLAIQKHDRQSIEKIFKPKFEIVEDFEAIHITPSGSEQNFYWAILKKL